MRKFNLRGIFTDREMSAEERRGVLEDLFVFGKQNQTPYLVRMAVLLVLSTIIATSGLLSNSAAVVIGAMLVAPLMNPVMAAAAAVVMGWPRRFYSSLWLVFLMGIGALLLSSLMTSLSPDLIFIPEQVMARTRPTYYDLLIALAAGAAGAYTITRKESGAIPGVAVAVALLPPLASAGILVMGGEFELAVRAVVLFLTNLVAMVLAGALTFIAVGISPAKARDKTAAFIRGQISLFLALTIAVSVPLWFYSEKVLFNARYKAAKSKVLQTWLQKNELELTDIDILRETRTLILALEGPTPPINIGELHEQVTGAFLEGEDQPFKIEYTWTQKVSGVWPQQGSSISEIAKMAQVSTDRMIGNWSWQVTQYDADTAARPTADQSYTVAFDHDDKFLIIAPCGAWKGKYTFAGRALTIAMHKNWLSRCRDDEILKVFVDDLQRARAAFPEEGKLQITLADSGGVMYFVKQ